MKNFKSTSSMFAVLAFTTAFSSLSYAEEIKDEAFSLLADDLKYSQSGTMVTAKGNVNILSNRGNLWADKLTYNTETGRVIASDNVVYENEDGVTVFLDSIELDGEMKAGVLKNIRVRIGKTLEEGPKLAATEATRNENGVLSLKNAVYSPCDSCEDDDNLPWKIRADLIEYDQPNNIIKYEDASLDIYGTPIVYLPYFRHTLNNKPLSGFLPPRFGNSTRTGFETKLAYYKNISENHDATARVRLMTDRGAMLGLEHRIQTDHLYSNVRGNTIEDDLNNTWRSSIKGQTEYVFKPGTRAGLNLNLASDDTYLDDFFDENPSHLTSTAYLEDASEDHYYAATATFFQDQKPLSNDDTTAQVLPQFTLERTFKLDHNNTNTFTASANVLSLHRSEGTSSQRIVTEFEYRDIKFFDSGDKFDFSANLRTDLYNIDLDSQSASGNEGLYGRFLPQMSIKWERPMVSASGYHKITPIAMAVISPRGGNPEEIPNEDSVAYELDTSNLFDTNRFAGYDRIETGPRIIYGLDNQWGSPTETKWRAFIGQSYRFFNDNDLPTTGGAETKASDWVGLLEAKPYEWLTLSSKFRMNNTSIDTRRMDNSALIGDTNDSYISITHSQLDGGPEEVKITGQYIFNEKYSFEGEVHRDLTNGGRLLNTEGQINYTAQCYKLSFKARRRGFDNRNVPPSTDYLFNVELLTLGRNYE